jgi:hypothetical protein
MVPGDDNWKFGKVPKVSIFIVIFFNFFWRWGNVSTFGSIIFFSGSLEKESYVVLIIKSSDYG